nr:MAG TPA: hypothetical protein [Bacteriophage sp.]
MYFLFYFFYFLIIIKKPYHLFLVYDYIQWTKGAVLKLCLPKCDAIHWSKHHRRGNGSNARFH